MFRKVLSIVMACALIHTTVGFESISAASKAEKRAERRGQVKAKVSQLGVDAEVMVTLKNEPNIKGKVEAIEDEGFLLATKHQAPPRRINYDQVSQINLAKLSYHAAGQPDAAEVRRVVVALGKDKQAKVTLAQGKRLQGKIQGIEQDHFTITDSKTGAATKVPYSDVSEVKAKSFPRWGYAAIGGGVFLILGLIFSQLVD